MIVPTIVTRLAEQNQIPECSHAAAIQRLDVVHFVVDAALRVFRFAASWIFTAVAGACLYFLAPVPPGLACGGLIVVGVTLDLGDAILATAVEHELPDVLEGEDFRLLGVTSSFNPHTLFDI